MARWQQDKAVGFKNVHLLKPQTLGIGSYGKVCKAKCDDLLCAAKLMHETLFDPTVQHLITPNQHRLPMGRLEQECVFLSTVRHPNIVQYLGVYRDPDTGLPVLLMELMDDSLTHFLESSAQPIPYHIQVNICHDITLALSFLHSNNIVHRNLSSNNVLLLTGNVRAKVTDFGMARLGDQNPQITHRTFTMCPSTDVYMPPEAVQDEPVYTEKIDCFSYGVIIIQILTQQYPNPGSRRREIQINHPGLPSGVVEVRISETERRENHISEIDPNHSLVQIALNCLKDKSSERPSAQQLSKRVAALKESSEYRRSVSEKGKGDREFKSLEQQHAQQVQSLQQVLTQKDQTIQELRQQIHQLNKEKNQLVMEKERQLGCINQRLKESEKAIAQFQRPSTVELRPVADATLRSKQQSSSSSIKLIWRMGNKAPFRSHTNYTSSVLSGTLYLRLHDKRVYAYTVSTATWSRLPDSNFIACPSVVINNLLTLIGGTNHYISTNQLFSLTGNGRDMRWTEKFPSMPTRRWGASAVCTTTALIVVGGTGDENYELKVVEVMNIETLQWSTAADLPEPLWCAPAAVCGDQIYILTTNAMYTCSDSALIQCCRSRATVTAGLWNRLAAPPVTHPTCVFIDGRLLTIGGMDSKLKSTTAIHMYNQTANSWGVISNMRTPRYNCFAAVLPNNELMVVGGGDDRCSTNAVEFATVE